MKNVYRPSARRPYRRRSFTCHQHGMAPEWRIFLSVIRSRRQRMTGIRKRARGLVRILDAQKPRFMLPCFCLGACGRCRLASCEPSRKAASRPSASIPRATLGRSPEARALGPAVIYSGVAITALSFRCLLNRSRDRTLSRVPPLSRRRYADPPAGASRTAKNSCRGRVGLL